MSSAAMIERFFHVIEFDILPKTIRGVAEGHKIFGAAILRRSDMSLVTAETNHEGLNPMWHGEVFTIKTFFDDPEHPAPGDCIFLSTHEPCSMCLSALAWSGFKEVYFLFGYDETKDDFDIPDDIRMLKEIFRCNKPSRKSSYLELWSIPELLEEMEDPSAYLDKIGDLKQRYLKLSEQYFNHRSV